MKNIFIIISLLLSTEIFAQQVNSGWPEALNKELEQFKACGNKPENGINPCSMFIGQALTTVYKIDDFYSKDLGRHMLVNEIAQYLKSSKNWTLTGPGYEQQALKDAQTSANAKKAVVAVYLDENETGLVSLILPGELRSSGTWGLLVPNSAAFLVNDPEKSYVGKGLSFALEKRLLKNVLLYTRSY